MKSAYSIVRMAFFIPHSSLFIFKGSSFLKTSVENVLAIVEQHAGA